MIPQVREAQTAPFAATPDLPAGKSFDFAAPNVDPADIANDQNPATHKPSRLVARRRRQARLSAR